MGGIGLKGHTPMTLTHIAAKAEDLPPALTNLWCEVLETRTYGARWVSISEVSKSFSAFASRLS
jgi:hypothetical protein